MTQEERIKQLEELNNINAQRITDMASMMAVFVKATREKADNDVHFIKMVAEFSSDYVDRIAILENRPRIDVLRELNARLLKSNPDSHLRIV